MRDGNWTIYILGRLQRGRVGHVSFLWDGSSMECKIHLNSMWLPEPGCGRAPFPGREAVGYEGAWRILTASRDTTELGADGPYPAWHTDSSQLVWFIRCTSTRGTLGRSPPCSSRTSAAMPFSTLLEDRVPHSSLSIIQTRLFLLYHCFLCLLLSPVRDSMYPGTPLVT